MRRIYRLLESSQIVGENNLDTKQFEGEDNYEVFTSTVLGSANDMWTNIFNQHNLTYTPPSLVLFLTTTNSSCVGASSETGQHYCPFDETIY
jgi:predicted metalloprotease